MYCNSSVQNFMADVVVTLATLQNFQSLRSLGLLHIFHKYQAMILIVLSNYTILLYSIETEIHWVHHNLSDSSRPNGNLAGIIGCHVKSVSCQMTTLRPLL